MRYSHTRQAGFTLLEVLISVVIVGILAAISTPSWLSFLANREVEAARDQLNQGIRRAQTQAIAHRTTWQLSIRERDDQVEWAIHAHSVSPNTVSGWQALNPKIVLDEANTQTLEQDDVHYIAFDFQGMVAERSIVTLESLGGVADKKCVLVRTLLGGTYEGQELAAPMECF